VFNVVIYVRICHKKALGGMNKDTQRKDTDKNNRFANVSLILLCLSFQGVAIAGVLKREKGGSV